MRRWLAPLVVFTALLATAAVWTLRAPGPHTVVFVVLDTVRADHLSLCGYERPTSPTLEHLRQRGAAVSCSTHAPSFWTLPSHSSYFTGLDVIDHGVLPLGVALPKSAPTLAEAMAARGYRTAMVSANPLLSEPSGLQRGFAITEVQDHALRGKATVRAVRRVLARVHEDEPLFLFVNVFDAHDPYPAIPRGVGWVPPQRELPLTHPERWLENLDAYHDYAAGALSEPEAAQLRRRVRNGYDYGIRRADSVVAGLLDALERRSERPFRLVITADHGEFLGEHELLTHNCCLFEPVVRVPLLFLDPSAREQPDLTGAVPWQAVHHLVRDGALPPAELVPMSVGSTRDQAHTQVALWASETEKLVADRDARLLFDLAADPDEVAPQPLGAHPLARRLEVEATRATERFAETPSRDEELLEMLEAAGYVERTP